MSGNMLELYHSVGGSGNRRRTFVIDEDSNRLLSSTVGSNTPLTENYSYDNRGNLTGGMIHLSGMVYNVENRLEVVTNIDTDIVTYYQYDSNGQRVRKTTINGHVHATNMRKYVGGWELYEERDSLGDLSLSRESLHVSDDSGRIVLIETRTDVTPVEQTVRYQYSNHLGSAALELDEVGAVISYEEYYPYGSTSFQVGRSSTEVSLKRYRYSGKERDEETGLYYHGARYYIPWLARWSAVDPLQSEMPEWSSYNYGFCNPITWTDSTGMAPDENWHPPMQKMGQAELSFSNGIPEMQYGGGVLDEVVVTGKQANELPEVIIVGKRIEKASDGTALGKLSEKYETGGRGPGVVSSGMVGKGENRKPDPGGVSYGSYQFTSKTKQKDGSYVTGGRVKEFLNSPEGASWKNEFAGLTPGSEAFSEVWRNVASRSPEAFANAQHAFIERTHYNVAKANLAKTIGLNIDERSAALRDVVWSTAVQHGPRNEVFQNALSGKNIAELSDEQIITAVYSERGLEKGDALKYFSWANTKAAQAPLVNRFKNEMQDALKMLSQRSFR
jgi:RHS repeat-associated protein